jgi:uncharacterized protein YhaN
VQYVSCKVHRHGLFDNRVIDFSDRLNIVYGKNGSGKSLLARGMVDAVWGKFSERKLLGADAWNGLFLDLIFSLTDTGRYRVCTTRDRSYRLMYVLGADEKTIYAESMLEGSGAAREQGAIGDDFEGRIFQEFVKRIDLNTFINSSFIPSAVDMGGGSLVDYQVLKRIILDDSSSFYNHYLNLSRAFPVGSLQDETTPPEVLRYEDKRRELEKKIQIIDISGSRNEKLRKERATLQREIDELNGSYNSLNSQKEILFKIIENLKKVDELKNEFENIKNEIQDEQLKIKSISDMKTELDTMFPHFSDIDISDSSNLELLQDVFNDIRNLNEQIDDFYFRRELQMKRLRKAAIIVAACGAAAVALIIGKSGFQPMKDPYLWAGAGALACLVDAVIGVMALVLMRRDRGLHRLEEEKIRFKDRIRVLMEKSRVELEDYKLTEIYELLLQYFEDYVNYTERKKDLARIKSSLKEEDYMIRIQKKLDALKKEEQIIKDEIHTSIDTLNIVDDIENETSKIEELIRNIDLELGLVMEKIETKERILKQIDLEFVQKSGNGEAASAVLDEKKSVDRVLKKWKANRTSMLFITENLARAVERSEEKRLGMLLDGTIEKFNHLTGNQYITKIDDSMVREMVTRDRVSGDLTPPVIHALQMSLKFSLSDFIIGGGTAVPLLIDEPFQFMDDERCNRFRDLVSHISNNRQVIIFTHHSDKRSWGNFIEL